MKVPYFVFFPHGKKLWIHPFFLTKEAVKKAYNEDVYRYDRFRVWRWMGAL